MTRLVCISDTHNLHEKLELPEGDVLIHAGDFSMLGHVKETIRFIRWFAEQPHKHKILIAGNHDVTLDKGFYQASWQRFHRFMEDQHSIKNYLLREESIHYLEDSSVTLDGIKFYGSPYQPAFGGWAFNVNRGLPIRAVWSAIPDDTDVLITHGPPAGYGDTLDNGESVGCEDLLQEITERVKPRVHVFGHIHEGYGITNNEHTTFINPCSCNSRYKIANAPIIFDLPSKDKT